MVRKTRIAPVPSALLIVAGCAGLLVLSLAGCDAAMDAIGVPEPPIRSVQGVSTDVAAIVGTFGAGPLNRAFLIESMEEFSEYYGGVDPRYEATYHVRAFFENGGERIWVSRAEAATVAALLGLGSTGEGMGSLDEANRFNQLLIPELFTAPAITDRVGAAASAIAYASSRGAMMLLDPPAGTASAGALIDWLNESGATLADRHAALFYGRVKVREGDHTGATRWIGASGAAAGIYAWNDRERGVWGSPAGMAVPPVAGAMDAQALTTDEMGELTNAQVIPIVSDPVRLWGARTLAPASSEFTFVAVQRLTLYLESRVRDALGWTAGEPMSVELWEQSQSDAEAVLHELWLSGALKGITTNEAYYARCDATTHSINDIATGRLRILVGYAPLKPADFIVRTVTLNL